MSVALYRNFYGKSRIPTNPTQTIAYNNANLQYLGRWQDTGSGMWTGWSSPMVVFSVSGTNWIQINTTAIDPSVTAIAALLFDVDNVAAAGAYVYVSSPLYITGAAGINKSAMIMLPDTGTHNITLHTVGYNADVFNELSKLTILSYNIPATATISTWTQGAKIIQCVGDSWMGAGNDWPRLMSTANYKLYPIGAGGLQCSQMDTQYNFNYAGNAANTDSTADAVIVSFGVNDFNASVTTATFETAMFALYDKIRAKQATAKIFLIRVPKNIAASKDYGQYGPNMATVVAARTNCFYVDTTSLDATIEWADGDVNHLSANGKQTLADFVKAALVAQGV